MEIKILAIDYRERESLKINNLFYNLFLVKQKEQKLHQKFKAISYLMRDI
jgi:hypothetical protein